MKLSFILLVLLLVVTTGSRAAVYPFADSFGKWGIISNRQEVIVAPSFKKMDFFFHHEQDDATAMVIDEKAGLINAQGKLLIPCRYDSIGYCSTTTPDLVWIAKDRKTGLASRINGSILVPPEYDSLNIFSSLSTGYIAGYVHGRKEYLDLTGQRIAQPDLQSYEGVGMPPSHAPSVIPPGFSWTTVKYKFDALPAVVNNSPYRVRAYQHDSLVATDTFIVPGGRIDSFLINGEEDNRYLMLISSLQGGKKGLATFYPATGPLSRGLRIHTSMEYDEIRPLYQGTKLFCWLLIKDGLVGAASATLGKEKIPARYKDIRYADFKVDNTYRNQYFLLLRTCKGNTCYADIVSGKVFINE